MWVEFPLWFYITLVCTSPKALRKVVCTTLTYVTCNTWVIFRPESGNNLDYQNSIMTHSEKNFPEKFLLFLKRYLMKKNVNSQKMLQKNMQSIHKICLCIFGNRRPNKFYFWKRHLVLSIYRYLTWCVKA